MPGVLATARSKGSGVPACKTAKFLGERLRELRKRHHLTQEEAARLTATEYKYWQILEAGGKDLRLTTIEKIAEAFGLQARQLFLDELPESALTGRALAAPHRPRPRNTPSPERTKPT
ncbi:MAG: XRE family transcriptional regulator [Verrucomicrobiaceae bacterium]|nr:MAG: XRE family transcriptional regulator [Verrucomicrobiaceae bacterium]